MINGSSVHAFLFNWAHSSACSYMNATPTQTPHSQLDNTSTRVCTHRVDDKCVVNLFVASHEREKGCINNGSMSQRETRERLLRIMHINKTLINHSMLKTFLIGHRCDALSYVVFTRGIRSLVT